MAGESGKPRHFFLVAHCFTRGWKLLYFMDETALHGDVNFCISWMFIHLQHWEEFKDYSEILSEKIQIISCISSSARSLHYILIKKHGAPIKYDAQTERNSNTETDNYSGQTIHESFCSYI